MKINSTVDFLQTPHLPINRENYLAVAYLGNPPEGLDAEQEAEIQSAMSSAAISDSGKRNPYVVHTPYDSDFFSSVGFLVPAWESGLALILDGRLAGPEAFDQRLTEDDHVLLREIGIRRATLPVVQKKIEDLGS